MPDLKHQLSEILLQRRQRALRRLEALRRVEARFPWIRLAVLVLGLAAAYAGFQLLPRLAAWGVLAAALAAFALAAVLHRQVIDRMARLEAFARLLAEREARLLLDWPNIPAPAPVTVPAEHPFAADLNITGERSLHHLLDSCVSLGGSLRLAGWLLDAEPDTSRIDLHQRRVQELIEVPVFRTRLELDGRLAGSPPAGQRWDGSGLLRWLEQHRPAGRLAPFLAVLSVLAAANISLFVLNALGKLPPIWIGTMVVYLALQSFRFRQSSEVFEEAYTLARQLGPLRGILAGLEDYPYQPGASLSELCAPFLQGSQRPSRVLRRISGIVTAASLRNNPFLGLLLNLLVPWDLFFAYLLERFKVELRGLLPGWLDAWYELEALSALAGFAALNPAATFPVILPAGDPPVFHAEAIGHPLIPEPARVDNDFNLQQLGEVVIITGSNMSGKSTFLRTLGINLVLAYAGGPVTARVLRAQPLRLYTSMNLADSLSDGISFFYAEVRRLKALLDRLSDPHPLPLFFLIDEIFRGTNNRERQVGSRAYTQALAGKHGAGLISTHDLELAHLAETIPSVRNQHFREDVLDGRMVFDYKVRPGPSPTTNALRIMALAGLPVPPREENPGK